MTQGYGDFGFNGNTVIKTPFLDSWAADPSCVKIKKFYTYPVCAPSRSAFMTGSNTSYVGVPSTCNSCGEMGVSRGREGIVTWPEICSLNGHKNYHLGKNHFAAFTVPYKVKSVAYTNVSLSGTQTIDGVALLGGQQVLLTAQNNPAENGVWKVSTSTWVRSTDADAWGKMTSYIEVVKGNSKGKWFDMFTGTETGTVGIDPIFVMNKKIAGFDFMMCSEQTDEKLAHELSAQAILLLNYHHAHYPNVPFNMVVAFFEPHYYNYGQVKAEEIGGPWQSLVTQYSATTSEYNSLDFGTDFTSSATRIANRAPIEWRNYAGAMSLADHAISQIHNQLVSLGIANNTAEFFFSDNGPETNSACTVSTGNCDPEASGSISGDNWGTATGTWEDRMSGGKSMVFQGGIQAPFLFRCPVLMQGRTVTSTIGSVMDMGPTILALYGIHHPETMNWTGENILPILDGSKTMRDNHIVINYESGARRGYTPNTGSFSQPISTSPAQNGAGSTFPSLKSSTTAYGGAQIACIDKTGTYSFIMCAGAFDITKLNQLTPLIGAAGVQQPDFATHIRNQMWTTDALFDLSNDPLEQQDVRLTQSAKYDELKAFTRQQMRLIMQWFPNINVDYISTQVNYNTNSTNTSIQIGYGKAY